VRCRTRVRMKERHKQADHGAWVPYSLFGSMRFIDEYDVYRSAMTVARFDPTGKHIFIGTSSGSVLVFNTRTKSVSSSYKVPCD
jgi:hypothetical protein